MIVGPSRADVLAAVAAALAAAGTLAGANVFARRIWPVSTAQFPAILLSAPLETKASLSRSLAGAPTFDTSVTIAVVMRAAAKASATGATVADEALDQLCAQVENVLLTDPGILALVQGIGDVATQFTVTAEGAQPVAEASIAIAYVVRQQFQPDGGVQLTDIQATRLDQAGVPHPFFDLPIFQGPTP